LVILSYLTYLLSYYLYLLSYFMYLLSYFTYLSLILFVFFSHTFWVFLSDFLYLPLILYVSSHIQTFRIFSHTDFMYLLSYFTYLLSYFTYLLSYIMYLLSYILCVSSLILYVSLHEATFWFVFGLKGDLSVFALARNLVASDISKCSKYWPFLSLKASVTAHISSSLWIARHFGRSAFESLGFESTNNEPLDFIPPSNL
jgi:hypothetical protein